MIFFDMDGTLAKFYYHPQYLELMYEQGYFRNLQPYKLADYANNLAASGVPVAILSACIDSPYCEQEKRAWLKQYLPAIDENHYIFTHTGENKAEAARKFMEQFGDECKGSNLFLVDDYGENLEQWENGTSDYHYFPIKYFNGINGTKKKKYKYSFKTIKQFEKLISTRFWVK